MIRRLAWRIAAGCCVPRRRLYFGRAATLTHGWQKPAKKK